MGEAWLLRDVLEFGESSKQRHSGGSECPIFLYVRSGAGNHRAASLSYLPTTFTLPPLPP